MNASLPSEEPLYLIYSDSDAPKPQSRQWLVVLSMAVLCDVVIYRGNGYAGYSLLFILAPILFCIGRFSPARIGDLTVVAVMLILLAARLVWYGSILQASLGFALLTAFVMTLNGLRPYVLETIVFASQTIVSGYVGLSGLWRATRDRWLDVANTDSAAGHEDSQEPLGAATPTVRNVKVPVSKVGCSSVLGIALPLGAFLAFGMLFLLANPDLMSFFGDRMQWLSTAVRDWFVLHGPRATEVLFWIAVIWISAGALCPLMKEAFLEEKPSRDREGQTTDEDIPPALLYAPFRNMLLTVIALFAAYLMFEYKTLWFRVFPEGFHYSGYAHEGAFWLTVALGLATVILSLVFRGSILKDWRQPHLRHLAWIWSAENFLLAAAVYHRLLIYVGFNGMTRMRVVGFLGISAVVVGFILVLRKIATDRDFVWLIRRQMWALCVAVFLYAVMPVDVIVMRYNTRRIMNGDPAPCVQISVHPIDPDGIIQLMPLLDCENATIRKGLHALLAKRLVNGRTHVKLREQDGWTAFQWADHLMLQKLESAASRLANYQESNKRERVLEEFHDYAYQWY